MSKTCNSCGGKGGHYEFFTCTYCGGEGCHKCNNNGQIETWVECPKCDGSGKLFGDD